MTSQLYFFNDSDSSKLEIAWHGRFFDIFKSNFTIVLNNQVIDTVKTHKEMEQGKSYTLSDSSTINARLLGNRIQVTHNKHKVKPHPKKTALNAYRFLPFFGLYHIFIGFLEILSASNEGASPEQVLVQGYTSVLFGLLILTLSPISQKTKSIALHWLIIIFVLLAVIIVHVYGYLIIDNEGTTWLGGIALSIFALDRTYEAIRQLKKQD